MQIKKEKIKEVSNKFIVYKGRNFWKFHVQCVHREQHIKMFRNLIIMDDPECETVKAKSYREGADGNTYSISAQPRLRYCRGVSSSGTSETQIQ